MKKPSKASLTGSVVHLAFLFTLASSLILMGAADAGESVAARLSLDHPQAAGLPAKLRLTPRSGERYEIQVSSDLKSWKTLHADIGESEAERLFDRLESEDPQMFYRVVIRPATAKETIKVTRTYTSGRLPGSLKLGEDPAPHDPDAPPFTGGERPSDDIGDFFFVGGDVSGGAGGFGDADGGGIDRPATPAAEDGGAPGFRPPAEDIIDLWPGPDPEPQPGAHLLTAAEWNDHAHWAEFQDFLREYPDHFTRWQLDHQ